MIRLSLFFCVFQSILTVTASTTNLQSILDTVSNTIHSISNEIQLISLQEGIYSGHNIDIKHRSLELSGEQSTKRTSPAAHIIPQSESESFPNEGNLNVYTRDNCIFSLTNSTLSLESLHISLVDNSQERRQQKNEPGESRLAIVSDSILTISESSIEVSSWTSSILISPSKLEQSSMQSSVMLTKCLISNEIGQLRGIVETSAFPDCGGSVSISLVDCSFDSQAVLGTDGIGLSLIPTARKGGDDVKKITSSLIGCSFVNMSSIGSNCPPQLSHLSQKMLGCVVLQTSSHLSGSTIRDLNTGGSVLSSNSSFSTLLSSPNTDSDPSPSITLPDGTHPDFEDGTVYNFTSSSGVETTSITFSHYHFTGANYASNVHPLSFIDYPGTIKISSCSFTDHTYIGINNFDLGGMIFIEQGVNIRPVSVEASNFTHLKTTTGGAGMSLFILMSSTIADCTFKECEPTGQDKIVTGGLYLNNKDPSGVITFSNLVFESCSGMSSSGGMSVTAYGTVLLSDCLFNDCSVLNLDIAYGGLTMNIYGIIQTLLTRVSFIDCRSPCNAAGMGVSTNSDFQMTDVHFLRCKTREDLSGVTGGGFLMLFQSDGTLTIQDCSFVECSTTFAASAFDADGFGSCVISDCLVKDCYTGGIGAIVLEPNRDHPSSISLTRVAFINNSIGQAKNEYTSLYVPENAPCFVDVSLTIAGDELRPTFSIVDCFTTCPTISFGMGVIIWVTYHKTSMYGLDDDAFNNVGPLLMEGVEVSVDAVSGRMELEMKCNLLIESQKYEMTIRNEGDKTEMKGEVEFVDGKGTLTSPSPAFNLTFSTSFTITSIVGIVPSSPASSSSLSNAIPFPQAAWVFNLAATPSFVSFTTPEQPPTLIGAAAHLLSSSSRIAVVFLHFDQLVKGSFDVVVEDGGKDVSFTVQIEESAQTGESSEIVVVGEDRLLTHDTTYTIKGITPTPGTESPFVRMSATITFHIPKSSYVAPKDPEEPEPKEPEEPDPEVPKPDPDDKKALSAEMKAMLSWLIPVVVCVCVALIVIIVIIVLVNRRRSKANIPKSEMEEQDPVEDEKAIECGGADSIGVVGSEGSANSQVSQMNQDINNNPSTLDQSRREEVNFTEVMVCSGDFGVSTARMDQTLYSILHEEGRAIGKRAVEIQVVNGLKEVVAHRGWSDVLTRLSSHWILLDSAGTVHLKLQMNSSEAEQEAARQRHMQQPLSTDAEKNNDEDKPQDENQTVNSGMNKSGMDGLRWRAPEVVAAEGRSGVESVDGHKASVFSLGLVLWEIETGQVPFGELDAVNAQRQSGTGIGPKMESLKDDSFVSLIHRCVSVDPDERPTLSEIGEFLSSHPEDTHLPSD
ncbi:hypothetical protein BLNAU_18126 [Blattamonas nauphoetae]|uniref:Protein kinase domain-containing protein n=1 Tax=Blattamonas nauphoetae TaxID=2049346 RepID=A0ABQ9X5V2_9EUKA|nr:hypothetical protein BLNAU_18126 [Blattamonas nauphoetae]